MKQTFYNEKCENSKKTLLIVDDNELVRQELYQILSDEYNIITADNGKSAAGLLDSEYARISLILLSGSINKADEYTVMSAVRRFSQLKDIPTIVILPENSCAAKSAHHLGAADYICVPLDENTVRRRVKNTLLLYEKPSLFDTTDTILQQERSRRSYYESLSSEIMFEYSRKSRLLKISSQGAKRLGITNIVHNPQENMNVMSFGSAALQNLFSKIRSVNPAAPNIVHECRLNIRGEERLCTLLIRVLWSDADERYSRLIGKMVFDGGNSVVSERSDDVKWDLLTGLYSRKAARRIIERRLSLRDKESYVMILMDIDRLKNINECYGHDFGDRVLIDFAEKFKALLSTDGVAARVGGDEFMVFFSCDKNAADAVQNMYDKIFSGFGVNAASACMGVSACPDGGTLYDELYHKADVALCSAMELHLPICFYNSKLPDFPHIRTPIDVKKDNSPNGEVPA